MFKGIIGGIQLSIIDLVLVFAVLGTLALVMYGLKYLVGGKVSKKTEIAQEVSTLTPPDISTAQEEHGEDKEELMAVISAAVASLWEKPGSRLRILKIRRVDTGTMNLWTAMGRQELMFGKNIKY